MQYNSVSPEDYINQLPEEKKWPFNRLRQTIKDNLPKEFEEGINYNMIGYYVPHTMYAKGYHCNPKSPLPFINIASQKNFIALYHMGLYANKDLLDWFVNEYPKHCKYKLDMGKSCIRFKKMEAIPFELIGELVSKMTAEEWIGIYETHIKKE